MLGFKFYSSFPLVEKEEGRGEKESRDEKEEREDRREREER